MNSDITIVHRLYEQGFITSVQREIWIRVHAGETIYSMRNQYSVSARSVFKWYEKTEFLIAECQRVQSLVASERLISDTKEDSTRWHISVARGHVLDEVDDPTPRKAVCS